MTRNAGASLHLGDSHNFGRRVELRAGRVRKPRAVTWERLFLSAKSPLRRLLARAAKEDALAPGYFDFLPDLAFVAPAPARGGEVERVTLRPLGALRAAEKRELARIVGRSLALWSWFGVSDLHWENLVLGRDAKGHIVFTPLDVEMILADLAAPTETKLLPDADPEYAEVCRHAAGVRRVLPYLGKPLDASTLVTIASSYVATLAFLDRHAPAIAEVFSRVPALDATPIRVCLRGTDVYVHARSEPVWPPLLDAEAEQLARGDIPYFFRLYGRPGIHYFADADLRTSKRLPSRGDVPQLDPILSLARHLRSPSRKRLREEGLFTVLGAFDHPRLAGHWEAEGMGVTFGARKLLVKLPNGEELEVRRDLRPFVGSVYLPCRCGEVRTVFVPEVTVCREAV